MQSARAPPGEPAPFFASQRESWRGAPTARACSDLFAIGRLEIGDGAGWETGVPWEMHHGKRGESVTRRRSRHHYEIEFSSGVLKRPEELHQIPLLSVLKIQRQKVIIVIDYVNESGEATVVIEPAFLSRK